MVQADLLQNIFLYLFNNDDVFSFFYDHSIISIPIDQYLLLRTAILTSDCNGTSERLPVDMISDIAFPWSVRIRACSRCKYLCRPDQAHS